MWTQTGGPPDQPVIFFDHSTRREQEVPSPLIAGYRGYLMTDDYSGYNALKQQPGVERLGCWAHVRPKFVDAQKLQPKGKTGRADIALNMVNMLYRIEQADEATLYQVRHEQSAPVLAELGKWLEKTLPQMTPQSDSDKALGYLANN